MTNPNAPRQAAKWTWLELLGLSVAFFLIVWPVANIAMLTIFPPTARGEAGDFNVTKTANPSTATPGSQVTFSITLSSNRTGARINGLNDTVPASAVVQSVNCTGTGCNKLSALSFSGQTVSASGNFPNFFNQGESATINIVTRLATGATAGTLTNTVNMTDGEDFPYTASATLTVQAGPPLPTPTNTVGVLPTATLTNTPVVTSTATPTQPVTNTVAPTPTRPVTNTVAPTPTRPVTNTVAPTPTRPITTTTATPTRTATAVPTIILPTNTPFPTATTLPIPRATPTPIVVATGSPTPALPFEALTPVQLPTRSGAGSPSPTSNGVVGGPSTATPTFTAGPRATATTTAEFRVPTVGNNIPVPVPATAGVGANIGVVSGTFAGNNEALNSLGVSLILRSRNGTERVVSTSQIDSAGQYSFLSVKPTADGEVYFIRFNNPNGGSLRSFTSILFTFTGGRVQAPVANLSDVILGQPGSLGTSYQLPLTLNWNSRGQDDNYSISIYRTNSGTLVYSSGNLAGATAFTIPTNALSDGDYYAEVNLTNASGSGVAQRQFRFRLSSAQVVIPTATLVPDFSTATSTVIATFTTTPTVGATLTPTTTLTTTPMVSTTLTTTPMVSTTLTTTPMVSTTLTTTPMVSATLTTTPMVKATVTLAATSTPTPAPLTFAPTSTAVVGGIQKDSPTAANISATTSPVLTAAIGATAVATSTPTPSITLPSGSNSLPASGGELPVAGLFLAALTLGLRRVRLVIQTH